MNRREFMLSMAGGAIGLLAGGRLASGATAPARARVALVKSGDRASGIPRVLRLLGVNPVRGRQVLLKPNFNTADPFPASTHNDNLAALISELQRLGASAITVGERSGPPATADVLRQKGVDDLCRRLGVGLVNFEELPATGWVRVTPPKSHWRNGFRVARPVLDAECVVATCCLKTHQYGGVFTMALKLAVGMVHKGEMGELHSSPLNQRRMIAEINQAYSPALILLDGIEAFVDQGPMRGPKKRADVLVAGSDRIAVDAVGLAILKELGSNRAIMEMPIFAQEQIARAAELGLGVKSAAAIDIVTDDAVSHAYAEKLRRILARG